MAHRTRGGGTEARRPALANARPIPPRGPPGVVPPTPAALRRAPLHSEELGLELASGRERDLFLWFVASLLFGQRVSETIARRTFAAFVRHGLDRPEKIIAAGRDVLLDPVMHEGGYVRPDDTFPRKILGACNKLLDEYGASLIRLHDAARDSRDLEARLLAFYGIGPVTVNIFLRELRPWWAKADPVPLPIVYALARRVGIDLDKLPRKSPSFARTEAGLIRLRRLIRGRPPRRGGAEAPPT